MIPIVDFAPVVADEEEEKEAGEKKMPMDSRYRRRDRGCQADKVDRGCHAEK